MEAQAFGRRSIRLKGFDYSTPGAYFVTICVRNRQCLFGDVKNAEMILNDAGLMVQNIWKEIDLYYPGVQTDAFVVMPNHVHGIIVLGVNEGATTGGCPYKERFSQRSNSVDISTRLALPDVVHRFKTMSTKRYIDGVKNMGWQPFASGLWQRNCYEHIIQSENDMNGIRTYIENNSRIWHLDDGDNPVC